MSDEKFVSGSRCYSRSVTPVAWAALGLLGAVVAGLLGALYYLGAQINAFRSELGSRIEALDQRLTSRMDALASRFDSHMERHAG
jgi:hypothetical protein